MRSHNDRRPPLGPGAPHTRRRLRAAISGTLVLGLVTAGCGNTGAGSHTTGQATSSAATSTGTGERRPLDLIGVWSPVFAEERPIAARYTCTGADVSPPLGWTPIPKDTQELVLFIIAFKETEEPGERGQIAWAVTGLSPTLRGVAAGKLPPGAIVGRNDLGQIRYTACPPRGVLLRYTIFLFGLSHPLAARPGFPASAFRATVERKAKYIGNAGYVYKRA